MRKKDITERLEELPEWIQCVLSIAFVAFLVVAMFIGGMA